MSTSDRNSKEESRREGITEDLIALVEYTQTFKSLENFVDKERNRIKSPQVFRSTVDHIIGVYEQIRGLLLSRNQENSRKSKI